MTFTEKNSRNDNQSANKKEICIEKELGIQPLFVQENKELKTITTQQSIISVSVNKLDKLMDMMGEMVIAEAMEQQELDSVGKY